MDVQVALQRKLSAEELIQVLYIGLVRGTLKIEVVEVFCFVLFCFVFFCILNTIIVIHG